MIVNLKAKKPSPEITQDAVADALNALRFNRTQSEPSPLLCLMVVEMFLANPDLPPSPHNREFALQFVLTNSISVEFIRLRRLFSLATPGRNDDFHTIELGISADSQLKNPELLAWSWLYHHYVRPELNLDTRRFASLASINERTLRRYQADGVRSLTFRLIDLEWKVRCMTRRHQDHFVRRLYGCYLENQSEPLFN